SGICCPCSAPSAPPFAAAVAARLAGGLVAQRPDSLDNLLDRRPWARHIFVERPAHCGKMFAGRAAAAADDPCTGIAGKPCILGHQWRRARIMDLRPTIFRNAAIALDDGDGVG